jgi:hypothetical protein
MFDEELAFHERLTECADAAVPVPVSVAFVVAVWALLANVRVAVCAPVAVGLKVTVNEALLPTPIVCGSESPLTVNAELFELTALTTTLAPLAVSVPVAIPLLPSATLPTPIVPGETDN